MLRSLYTSESGMLNHASQVETISHNIANINTTAFKRRQQLFQDMVYKKNSSTRGGGVNSAAIHVEQQQGSLMNTQEPLNLAVMGEGYFVLTDPDGELRFSRDGAFHLDAYSRIVHSSGLLLDDYIAIPEKTSDIKISSDGTVLVREGKQPGFTGIGQIQLAVFSNPSGLTGVGQNLYKESSNSGDPEFEYPGENGTGTVKQGMLETSNVVLVKEMVSLLKAQRAFELNSKALQTSDSLIQTALKL